MKKVLFSLSLVLFTFWVSGCNSNTPDTENLDFAARYEEGSYKSMFAQALINESDYRSSEVEEVDLSEQKTQIENTLSIQALSLINLIDSIIENENFSIEESISKIEEAKQMTKSLNEEEALYIELYADSASVALEYYSSLEETNRGLFSWFKKNMRVIRAAVSGAMGAIAGAILGYAMGGYTTAIAGAIACGGASASYSYKTNGIGIAVSKRS